MPTHDSRVAIVTGSSSGLGRALAPGLIEQGWTVAGFDITKVLSQELEDEFTDSFAFFDCDVADYDSQAAAFSKVWERYGRIDALCANAGIIDQSSIYILGHRGKTEIPPKPDLSCTDIDYKGLLYGTQLAVHFMRQNDTPGGSIVATSSVCGVHPIESLAEYSGAKAAVIGFARATAGILKSKDNISINVVCPGCLATPNIPPFMRDFFGANMTPLSKIVDAYSKCLNDASINGQIIECAVDDMFFIPRPEYNSEASKMAGTVYDPLFAIVHGETSGLPYAQGVSK